VKIGVPRELKVHEYRVALTPAGVHELSRRGHDVLIERKAGVGCAFPDEAYLGAGARIVGQADNVWAEAELVLKTLFPVKPSWVVPIG